MAGLTDEGLEIKTQPEIQAEFLASHRANVSAGIQGTADSLVGNYDAILSDQLASLWELLEDVYGSSFPNLAAGFSLSQLVQITRTRRRDPTFSRVPTTVNVDPGTYPIGTLVAIVENRPDLRFANVTPVVNSGGSAADVEATFQAEASGPILAPSGTLTIGEFVSGWNSVTNAEDATPGLGDEQDPALRLRREQEVSQGSATADAIRSYILRANAENDLGIETVRVLFNDFDTPDSNGVPGHAIEVIVNGPAGAVEADDLALVPLIAQSKVDGIQASGSSTYPYTDEQGNETVIGFSRVTDVPIYLALTLTAGPATYAGADAVKAAIVALNGSQLPGDDAYYLKAACTALTVRGVIDVTAGAIGNAPSPSTQTPVAIGVREQAKFATGRIALTV